MAFSEALGDEKSRVAELGEEGEPRERIREGRRRG